MSIDNDSNMTPEQKKLSSISNGCLLGTTCSLPGVRSDVSTIRHRTSSMQDDLREIKRKLEAIERQQRLALDGGADER